MKTENFEEQLKRLSKPEVNELKHEDMLAAYISKSKDNSTVSLWWLSIPAYVIAALIMKSFFVPKSSFTDLLQDYLNNNVLVSILLFVFFPIIIIIINSINIKKHYFLYGNTSTQKFIEKVSLQIILIVISLIVLTIYVYEII